ncbi:MAG TPA: polysaccharide biosynthesis/export family protein [Polyangiaceae bacterium]|jgi:polysaccharide export outer membrane protein
MLARLIQAGSTRVSKALILWLASTACACSSGGSYVWVQELQQPPPQAATPYVIAPGDVLDIRVYEDERASARTRVRRDGRVTLGLIGDVEAAGRTPERLTQEIAAHLARFIQKPSVRVSVEEAHPTLVTVVGEVANPGVFTLTPGSGVLQALASAGGLTEFADEDRIYVVRKEPSLRIRFTYDALTRNDARAIGFVLADGDVVTIE